MTRNVLPSRKTKIKLTHFYSLGGVKYDDDNDNNGKGSSSSIIIMIVTSINQYT